MQRILRLSISLLMGCLALGYLPPIQAAEFCADNYYINVTLPIRRVVVHGKWCFTKPP